MERAILLFMRAMLAAQIRQADYLTTEEREQLQAAKRAVDLKLVDLLRSEAPHQKYDSACPCALCVADRAADRFVDLFPAKHAAESGTD